MWEYLFARGYGINNFHEKNNSLHRYKYDYLTNNWVVVWWKITRPSAKTLKNFRNLTRLQSECCSATKVKLPS